jgi:adenine-specific DNA-methyltransferase
MKIGTNEDAFDELKTIFGREKLYNYPKPTTLISYLAKTLSLNDKGFIILDFFAGSGTTGHAVWDLNKEDGGKRKFILVQLDEEVQDEEIKKEFPTVADICIERLRRVSEKYKKEREEQLIKNEMDFGFKVFKLDKSNFNLKDEFEFDPSEDKEELKKKYLEWLGMFVDQPLVSGWKEIDVIYEVMLKEGLNLNSKIEKVKIKNDEFYYVKDEGQNLEFYISLKDKFSKDTIEEIRTSKYKERMFVFLDNALTDSDKINLSAFVRLKVI